MSASTELLRQLLAGLASLFVLLALAVSGGLLGCQDASAQRFEDGIRGPAEAPPAVCEEVIITAPRPAGLPTEVVVTAPRPVTPLRQPLNEQSELAETRTKYRAAVEN